MEKRIFVQVGATRDGIDPYLDAAHQQDMEAILIETPDYIRWREKFNRKPFDKIIAVVQPANYSELLEALKTLPKTPDLILAGFERYTKSVNWVAKKLQVLPYFEGNQFTIVDKFEQRILLSKYASNVSQPSYAILEDGDIDIQKLNIQYPIVLKPMDGGGGLGVFLIQNDAQLTDSIAELKSLTNYDGGSFRGFFIESYISGTECSVQGLVQDGKANILTCCVKFIATQAYNKKQNIVGFSEVGHIAVNGRFLDKNTLNWIQSCIDAVGYQQGPFHLDMIHSKGKWHFIEIGFRLSGNNLNSLMQRAIGIDWGATAFNWILSKQTIYDLKASKRQCVGQMNAVLSSEIEIANQLKSQGYNVEIQLSSITSIDSTSIPNSLKSDFSRHTGSLGRIIITAVSFAEVKRLFQICSPKRAVIPDFQRGEQKIWLELI